MVWRDVSFKVGWEYGGIDCCCRADPVSPTRSGAWLVATPGAVDHYLTIRNPEIHFLQVILPDVQVLAG